jgi:hypothetical protein
MRLLVKTTWMARMRARWLPLVDGGDRGVERSVGERFALPYTFKPQLSFIQALIGTVGAVLRILLGSLLFAIWGTYSLVARAEIGSYFWRVAALVFLFLSFLVSLAALMLAISVLERRLSAQRP